MTDKQKQDGGTNQGFGLAQIVEEEPPDEWRKSEPEGVTTFEDWWQMDGGYRFGDLKKGAALAAWEWSSVVERSHFRRRLHLLRRVLAVAPRLGADQDDPEGTRYIQISDTLASELMKLLWSADQSDPPEMETHYGKDCPQGMVQIEFVGCSPSKRMGDFGWKPVESAFLEVYVDGKRFRIDVGDFHDGKAQRRGLHIVTRLDVAFEQTSLNACSVYLKEQEAKT
jgi:hypothetical protein